MSSDANRIAKQLGQTVRRLRTAEGISQIVLAEKAGLTHNFVGEIERGEGQASVTTLVKLAAAFGLKGGELLTKAKL